MDREEIVATIIDEIRQAVRVRGALDERTELLTLEIDSLDQMLLIADIEDTFDIEISGAERIDFVTVGDIADAVEKTMAVELRLAA